MSRQLNLVLSLAGTLTNCVVKPGDHNATDYRKLDSWLIAITQHHTTGPQTTQFYTSLDCSKYLNQSVILDVIVYVNAKGWPTIKALNIKSTGGLK